MCCHSLRRGSEHGSKKATPSFKKCLCFGATYDYGINVCRNLNDEGGVAGQTACTFLARTDQIKMDYSQYYLHLEVFKCRRNEP